MKSMPLDFSELCFKFMMGNVDITTENESLELLNYTNVEKLIFTLFFFSHFWKPTNLPNSVELAACILAVYTFLLLFQKQ